MRFVKFCIISRVVIEVIRKLSKEYSRRASFTLFILDKKLLKYPTPLSRVVGVAKYSNRWVSE